MIRLMQDYPNRASIDRTVRRQKIFTVVVLGIMSELCLFFSISLWASSEAAIIVSGVAFYSAFIAFGIHYLRIVREAGRSSFIHLKVSSGVSSEEHILRIKWPVVQIGPINVNVQQQQPNPTEIESTRLFSEFYVNTFARYLQRRLISPSKMPDSSVPDFQLLNQPTEHYCFDEETLRFFELEHGVIAEPTNRNSIIEKQDSLYLTILAAVALCATFVNSLLGPRVLGASVPILACLFLIPFYRGYLKGSLKDDFMNRLRGWESFILIVFMVPFVGFSFGYVLPNLFLISSSFVRGVISPLHAELLTGVLVGGVSLAIIFSLVYVGALVVRAVALRLVRVYFDNSPSTRPEILRAIIPAGDIRRISVNAILSAMLHRTDTEVRIGEDILRVQRSAVNSDGFVRMLYCKGWNWFLDLYVLCFGLVSTFLILVKFW